MEVDDCIEVEEEVEEEVDEVDDEEEEKEDMIFRLIVIWYKPRIFTRIEGNE